MTVYDLLAKHEALEAEVKTLRAQVADLERKVNGRSERTVGAVLEAMQTAAGAVATESELAKADGDPIVTVHPKRWTGEDCQGRRFSACPPAFLVEMAGLYDWLAKRSENEGKAPKGARDRHMARLARGWAAKKGASSDPKERGWF